MEIFSNAMGFIAVLMLFGVLILGIFCVIDVINKNTKPVDFSTQEKLLSKEREYFNMIGLVTYWALQAADELEMDPTEREEIIAAVDTIDYLTIEDMIYIDV